jgi:hypothetical protein
VARSSEPEGATSSTSPTNPQSINGSRSGVSPAVRDVVASSWGATERATSPSPSTFPQSTANSHSNSDVPAPSSPDALPLTLHELRDLLIALRAGPIHDPAPQSNPSLRTAEESPPSTNGHAVALHSVDDKTTGPFLTGHTDEQHSNGSIAPTTDPQHPP